MNFEIIRGMPEHASILTKITLAAKRHWNYPEKWIQHWIPELTFSPEYIFVNEVWLAIMDDEPVAFYSLILDHVVARSGATKQSPLKTHGLLRQEKGPPPNDINSLWLENLWVLPEYMGQGIGRQLFEHALERSRERGMSILKIEADPNAQGFYEKMGAHKCGEHQYELDGQLRVLPIMEISL